jgi:CheY-like chemotaxis protein
VIKTLLRGEGGLSVGPAMNRMKTVPQRVVYLFAGFVLLFCLLVFGFWYFGAGLFSVLLKRSRAYTPPQFLTWLSLISSLAVAVAFCIMPFSLFRIVRRRSDVPFGGIVLCIAGFLFLCGVNALFALLTIWFQGPLVIWSLVLTRVATALLSVATLLILRALVPRILEIPSREQWLAVNNELLRAEAETEAKSKLLNVASHELRTPLAPLLATLTELEQHVAAHEVEAAEDCIEVLRKNIQRQASLVTGLLDRLEVPAPEQESEPERQPQPEPQIFARQRRLLLVEDHLDTLRTFARILRQKGFDVQEATTVSEAISSSRSGDLLLSDIALPDGDGRDLMRQLRERNIPGIAISGFGSAQDREEYRRAGFSESFVKPVDIDELLGAIRRVTEMTSESSVPA